MDKKRLRAFRNFAIELASLSKCSDKRVGALITDEHGTQVYSIGVNGGPKGGSDCLCKTGGKYTCVHAEANALAKCTVADSRKVFFCTLSPCVTCAALIINSGASAVYYVEEYKDTAGLDMLRDAGIYVQCISDEALYNKKLEDFVARLLSGETLVFAYDDEVCKLLQDLRNRADLLVKDQKLECFIHEIVGNILKIRWVIKDGRNPSGDKRGGLQESSCGDTGTQRHSTR